MRASGGNVEEDDGLLSVDSAMMGWTSVWTSLQEGSA